ncbi:beta-lactamase family protein [Maribacter algarum]|uniref:Beta-lactamase family protein n=1 Tax=Maribacter algarum (ex Zhang et al. 2020) TaxID=2578118 RepID=A0A5S3PJ27_9FLAO|nr:serine hydrolase domain-containing protein [Maribacter algarum]TMM52104.1 beta-lactamase family protein [Maribacter algarum]
MKSRFFILAFICCTQFHAQTDIEVEAIVSKYRNSYKVPAIVASVIKYDTIFYGTSGVKKVDSNDEIQLDSKFHLGSNTKAITSMVAAKLVDDGILDWDIRLLDAVPELKNRINDTYLNITLEQLLSHRAMIHPFEDDSSKEWRKMPVESIKSSQDQKMAFAKYALNLSPAKNIKTNHLYSNGGYIIAGLLLEHRTGKTWEHLVSELFEDVGIGHYIGFPSQNEINDTHGHVKKGKSYKSVAPDKEYATGKYFGPAGNLSTSITDFSKLMRLHLRGLMGEDNLLKPATYQTMHFGLDKYSLGWYNGNIGETEQKFSYHGGSLGTFSSAVIISADRKIAIVILINADNKDVDQLKNELRVELWDKYGERDQ